MRTFTFTTGTLFGSLALLAAIGTTPCRAATSNESSPAIHLVADVAGQSAHPIVVTNGNADLLDKLIDASDDLDQNHKSRQSVLIFFGLPANLHFVGAELEKLSNEYGGKLTVVTVDPAYLSDAGQLQKEWVQGNPSYPTAVFLGNGVCLNQRGAISSASLEHLATEGMTWDYNRNHKP